MNQDNIPQRLLPKQLLNIDISSVEELISLMPTDVAITFKRTDASLYRVWWEDANAYYRGEDRPLDQAILFCIVHYWNTHYISENGRVYRIEDYHEREAIHVNESKTD